VRTKKHICVLSKSISFKSFSEASPVPDSAFARAHGQSSPNLDYHHRRFEKTRKPEVLAQQPDLFSSDQQRRMLGQL